MGAPPRLLNGDPIVRWSAIDARQRQKAVCQHPAGRGFVVPAAIAIGRLRETSWMLYRSDHAWNVIADTWHESLSAAIDQAEFEYEGLRSTVEERSAG